MLNPRENNPKITRREVALVRLIHTAIAEHHAEGSCGYCGLGALMVVGILGATDYDLMDGRGHWWAMNKHTLAILDPTADQFACEGASGEANARVWHYTNQHVHVVDWDYVMHTYEREWDDWAERFVNNERSTRYAQQRRSA